jgi:hypothetical protein
MAKYVEFSKKSLVLIKFKRNEYTVRILKLFLIILSYFFMNFDVYLRFSRNIIVYGQTVANLV